MKANDCIKKFGLDLAKLDVRAFESGFIKREDIVEHYGFDILDDLKRLVESHELVEWHGGLKYAKSYFERNSKEYPNAKGWDKLAEAIADVESCMEVKSEN